MNLYGYGNGDPINNSDPFGLCPNCRNELSSRYVEEELKFQEALTPGDRIVLGAMALAAVGGGALVMGGTAAVMGAAAAAPAVGGGTLRLIDALQKAGPAMDARVNAVSQWLPKGQKALQTTLEGGAKMLSGGAGKNARQVILNADGSTVVKAFNVGTKTYDLVTTIAPKAP